jgi:hypothetical protein
MVGASSFQPVEETESLATAWEGTFYLVGIHIKKLVVFDQPYHEIDRRVLVKKMFLDSLSLVSPNIVIDVAFFRIKGLTPFPVLVLGRVKLFSTVGAVG